MQHVPLILAERHEMLTPQPHQRSAFLQLAKHYLDPLAISIGELQKERQLNERQSRKRKRGAHDRGEREERLSVKRVHVEGFDMEQVWQQAKRVLNAGLEEVEMSLPQAGNRSTSDRTGQDAQRPSRRGQEVATDEGNIDYDYVDEGAGATSSEANSRSEYEENEVTMQESIAADYMERNGGESSDGESLDVGTETPASEVSDSGGTKQEAFVSDKFGLNDGFFSIDAFNRQSQFLEQQDARGDPNDGAASDEEDIDWTIDPLGYDLPLGNVGYDKPQRRERAIREETVEGEDDAPIFGTTNDDISDGDSEIDVEDIGGGGDFSNTNNVMYADFFAPPAKKLGKKRKKESHSLQSTGPWSTEHLAEDDGLERTVSAVHRDLFEDDVSDANDAESYPTDAQPTSNLSSYERTQLALRAEIRRLEAANVAEKPWSMAGEAVANSRPINSLLEEDLDFERTGKPVPVVTEEVNEDIEALIKRRIIDRNFDEVIRKRPNALVTGGADPRGGASRGVGELSDAKPARGLAEEYEQEHLRQTDPNFVDTRTEALKGAHRAIEKQWAHLSAQLDALCNWHHKPKPPGTSLEVKVDVPAIDMEDARPGGGGQVATANVLAPQEVYRPGDDGRVINEVRTKGGMAIAKEEETREQRIRRRRRNKERQKKIAEKPVGLGNSATSSGNTSTVANELRRSGAKVIDRTGNLRDVDGKSAKKSSTSLTGVGQFKL